MLVHGNLLLTLFLLIWRMFRSYLCFLFPAMFVVVVCSFDGLLVHRYGFCVIWFIGGHLNSNLLTHVPLIVFVEMASESESLPCYCTPCDTLMLSINMVEAENAR